LKDAIERRCYALLKTGKFAECKQVAEFALETCPKNSIQLEVFLAQALHELGNSKESCEKCDDALSQITLLQVGERDEELTKRSRTCQYSEAELSNLKVIPF
jgi:hypothetical protein